MRRDKSGSGAQGLRKTGVRLLQAAVLALLLMPALPGRAADERAVKSRAAPVYPEIAKRMRVTGVVRMEVTVDAEGKVTDVKLLSGNQMLAIAAEEAVRKWRYVPGPGQSTLNVDINFELGQ
jgi:TonB family protein